MNADSLMKPVGDALFVAVLLYLAYALAETGVASVRAWLRRRRYRRARREADRRWPCTFCGYDHIGRCSPRGE